MGTGWVVFLLFLWGSAAAGHQDESCPDCHATGRKIESRLCEECHAEIAKRSTRYRHGPLAGDCLACHRLHEPGGEPYLCLPETELCGGCHPDVQAGRSHPLGATVAGDGRALTCSSHCHDVHGTDHPFLCRLPPGRELCVSCHGENLP